MCYRYIHYVFVAWISLDRDSFYRIGRAITLRNAQNVACGLPASGTEKKNCGFGPSFISEQIMPIVTVQLPLYNERFVAERLVDAAAKLSWPKDRLEIQVLDDSADDTGKIVENRVTYWQRNGIDIKVVRRSDREGYKAGALNHGLMTAKGEYIAIFDADFVPPEDFLLRTLPCFVDRKIGMVQAEMGLLKCKTFLAYRYSVTASGSAFLYRALGTLPKRSFFEF